MKRLSILLLYLVTFVCLLNAKVIKGDCGAGMTWSFDPDKGILAFSGSGPMYDYSNGTPWDFYKNDVKTVALAKDVEDMPYYALKGCLSIETIRTEDGGNFFVEENCLLTKSDSTLIFAAKNFTIPSSTRIIGTKSFYENPSLQTLTIPEGVVTIADHAFAKCTALKTVSIPSTAKKISTGAFAECVSLMNIKIPDGVANIADHAFAKCTALKTVSIPSTVKKISTGAFANCVALTTVNIPKEGLVHIGKQAFAECVSLMDIKIPEGVVTIADQVFAKCTALKTVSIPSTVRKISTGAFFNCVALTTIDIPKEGLVNIGKQAFAKCVSLKNINIPSTVTVIGLGAFAKCSSIESVTIPASTELINKGAFQTCTGLKSLTFEEGVKVIDEYAFQTCSSLTSVLIPASVASLSTNSFDDCTELHDLQISESNPYYYTISNKIFSSFLEYKNNQGVFKWAFDKSTGKLTIAGINTHKLTAVQPWKIYHDKVTSVEIVQGITHIDCNAFKNFTLLSSVTFPKSLVDIAYNAFNGCSNLSQINIDSENKSYFSEGNCLISAIDSTLVLGCSKSVIPNYVKAIGSGAFLNNSLLKSIVLPDGLIKIGKSAFEGCTSLSFIDIPESVSKIDATAFSGCNALPVENTIHYADNWAVGVADDKCKTYIIRENTLGLAGTFSNCSNLKSICLPKGLKYIDDGAFEGCTSLSNISIAESVTDISSTAFKGCKKLPNKNNILYADRWAVDVANNTLDTYTLQENTVGLVGTFSTCMSLKTINIPPSVKFIGERTFYGCSSLIEINIPNSVRHIGDRVFEDCSSLRRVKVPDSLKYVGLDVFLGCSQLGRKIVDGLICYETQSTDILFYVTTYASFPGGDAECVKWLQQNIKNSAIYQEQGVLDLIFTIDKDGSVVGVMVYPFEFSEDFSEEALHIANIMPKWEPAVTKGETVRSNYPLRNFRQIPRDRY